MSKKYVDEEKMFELSLPINLDCETEGYCRKVGLAEMYRELTREEPEPEETRYSWHVELDFEKYETLKDWAKHSLRNGTGLPDYMSFNKFWGLFRRYIKWMYGDAFDKAHAEAANSENDEAENER